MSNEIDDDPIRKVGGSLPISQSDVNADASPQVDSGLSSIEKSKKVKPEITPLMNSPILVPAQDHNIEAFAVASVNASGSKTKNYIYTLVLKKEDEIKQSLWEEWNENLRQVAEYVNQLLASPFYQQLQEIRLSGPQSSSVSGIQGVSSENAAAQGGGNPALLSALDRLRTMERVPQSAEIHDTDAPDDSTQILVLPLTAALLAGGGLALGVEVVHSTNPLGGVVEIVERLQPLFPTVAVQDLVPLINLMIVGPLYFNSWNEAISNLKSRKGRTHVAAIQNFAKDVIKIISDPKFINQTLIKHMRGTEDLSETDQGRLAAMLKIVLIGVALSLLYSAEVGKVQDGKFGGIEPQEFRDLLLGKFENLPDPNKKKNLQEQLTSSLIHRCWEQLKLLSAEDRAKSVDMLLSYLSTHRDLEPMLNPSKVFDEFIAGSNFKTDIIQI